MSDPRFQFQPVYIKAYRLMIHKPQMPIRFAWIVCKWIKMGLPCHTFFKKPSTKLEMLAFFWRVERSRAAIRMGHWWTTEECLQDVRKRRD